eukprot:scaffold21126_cov62-Phaeocystis_antarctica.AAC.3
MCLRHFFFFYCTISSRRPSVNTALPGGEQAGRAKAKQHTRSHSTQHAAGSAALERLAPTPPRSAAEQRCCPPVRPSHKYSCCCVVLTALAALLVGAAAGGGDWWQPC